MTEEEMIEQGFSALLAKRVMKKIKESGESVNYSQMDLYNNTDVTGSLGLWGVNPE
jgi:hypothetical protein